MTTLDKKAAAFFHVIDSHRWLAASGCVWNQIKPGGPQEGKFDQDLPNLTVMVRDCLLLHARSLIKFYRCSAQRKPTDIVLCDFAIPKIVPAVDTELDKYERPIEVHLLHLTDHRDPDYRKQRPAPPGHRMTSRPDWNQEASVIAEKLIFECLRHASGANGQWQVPFKALYDATAARYRGNSDHWPENLGQKANEYLTGLHL
jgi:hypothetical protein